MKKLLTLILALILSLSACTMFACKEEETVALKYYAQAEELMPMLKTGGLSIGLLPEPAATKLTKIASDKTWYRMDLQELYDSESKAYPQAVVLVKESLLATCPDIVNQMSSAFDANVTWAKDNTADAVTAINSTITGFTPSLQAANITSEVVDNCKIYWQSAEDAKTEVKNYISAIRQIEATAANDATDELFYNGTVSGDNFDSNTVNVYAPDGAPALSIAKFIADGEDFGTGKTFNYTVVAASNIGGTVLQGKGDIVILPVNAASKLYKAGASKYKLVSVVTHGNLYIMSTEQLSVDELKGKTMGVIGQGAVPDLTLRAVLSKYSIKTSIAI